MELYALLCIACALILLIWMSVVDFKHMILPDELNAGLAVCGVLFHVLTQYDYMDWEDMAWGVAMGGGFLWGIRALANRHYGREAMGLGDVKLMAAAGVWLGMEQTLNAITMGAAISLIHGVIYAFMKSRKENTPFSIQGMTIPAGPGFVGGILIAGGWLYFSFVRETLYDLFS